MCIGMYVCIVLFLAPKDWRGMEMKGRVDLVEVAVAEVACCGARSSLSDGRRRLVQ